MNIGKAIKLCRTQRNMTRGDLAQAAELSTSYISLLEREKRDPNFGTVEAIAKALAVPLPILIFLAGDEHELSYFSKELNEKMAHTALELIRATNAD